MSITTAVSRFRKLTPLIFNCQIRIDWLSSQFRYGDRRGTTKGGTGRDFVDFRPLRFGDDLRRINQRMYAKRPERPQITLFEEEKTANFIVLADLSATMDMASVSISKRELAAVLAASILGSAAHTSDQAQFIAFSELGIVKRIGKRMARRLKTIAPCIMLDEESEELAQEMPDGMERAVRESLHGDKSLVFVISDFLGRTQASMLALKQLAAKHEVICLVVQDLRERELPSSKLFSFLPGLYTVSDVWGNQRTILTTVRARREHRERFDAAETELFMALEAAGCKYARMRTDYDAVTLRQKLSRIFAGRRGKLNLN